MKKSAQFGLLLAWFLSTSSPAIALRIITTSPQTTEILFQLGKGADIVASSQIKPPTPEAQSLPDIGPAFMPSIERTLRFQPDWIILDDFFVPATFESSVLALGIKTIKISNGSPEELFQSSRRILKEIYGDARGAIIEPYERCHAQLGRMNLHQTFIAFSWFEPPILFGKKSFLSSLMEKMGLRNLTDFTLRIAFPQTSMEWLLGKHPENLFYLRENDFSEKSALRQMAYLWKANVPPVIPLNPDHFGRASFTAFLHLKELVPRNSSVEIPDACRF